MSFYRDLDHAPDVAVGGEPEAAPPSLDWDDPDLGLEDATEPAEAPEPVPAAPSRPPLTAPVAVEVPRPAPSAEAAPVPAAPAVAPAPAPVAVPAPVAPAAAPSAPEAPAPGDPHDALTSAPFTGYEQEQTPGERLRDLNPGLTPVQVSEQIMARMDRGILREIVASLRKEEEYVKATTGANAFTDEELKRTIDALVREPARKLGVLDSLMARKVADLYSGLFGLEEYLDNPAVSDILINSHKEVFVEEGGVMHEVPSLFNSSEELNSFIGRLVGRFELVAPSLTEPIVDWNFPYILPDGSEVSVRANVILGSNTDSHDPIISMRKPVTTSAFDNLDTWTVTREGDSDSAMTVQAAEFLRRAVQHRATILIVGGTGSGKTSFLKSLVGELRDGLRIISVEQSQELVLKRPNARGLLAQGNLSLSQLVIAAMRMRPDVILIGECRMPAEATNFLAAANTGHDGSITTTHASGTEAGLYRLLNLINEDSTKASLEYVGGQILSGIDIVVFIAAQDEHDPVTGEDKRWRRVMEIVTVADFDTDSGRPRFTVKPVFGRYTEDNIGVHRQTNIHAPMRCEGFSGLAQQFVDKMIRFGMTKDELQDLLTLPKKARAPYDGDSR